MGCGKIKNKKKWNAAKNKVKNEYKELNERSKKFWELVQTIYRTMIKK